MKTVRTILTTAALASLVGCASLPNLGQSPSASNGQPNQKKDVMVGAGVGCAAGAVLAHFLHKNALAGCAVGGVGGGLVGNQIYQKQLAQYQALAAQARAAGLEAELKTKTVQDEQKQATQAVDRLTISYDPQDMVRVNAKTRGTLDKLSALIKKASETTKQTVEFDGQSAHVCSIPMEQLATRKALDNVNVLDRCGAVPDYAIVISPNPVH
jgi:uncharacterized protein YcfJ